MRHQYSALIEKAITGLIFFVVILTPLLFVPLTTEFFEIPKLILLIGAVLIMLVLWSVSWVIDGKVKITRTPLDTPLLLLLGVILISTFFSESRYIAIFGNLPRIHGSAITWVSYILFYFIVTSNIKTNGQIKVMLYALLGTSAIVSLVTLASYFGAFLPLPFARSANFTPTGSSFSTSVLMVLLLPIALISLIQPNRFLPLPAALVFSVLYAITLALIGDFATIIAAAAALVLILITTHRKQIKNALPFLVIPVIIFGIVFAAGYINPGNKNPLAQKRVDFPREIQLPFNTSWKVSASVFRDNPILGSGPSTFLFNFTQYKPAEFNLLPYWNVRFDIAHNEYLQVLATLGGLGFLAFVFFSFIILNFAWKGLGHKDNIFATSLAVSAILIVILLALHSSTAVTSVLVFTFLAMLMAIHKSISGKVEELTLGIKASKLTDSNIIVGDILPILLFFPIFILSAVGIWNLSRMSLADYYHRTALNNASSKGLETYNNLIAAENLNPYIDLYRTDLAQTNFALANAIAVSKGPNESSPSGSLTDEDKKNIQQLLSQSINEGRAATVISPKNSQNWEVLASIYRQITGVAQNALQFSLDSYGRAIQLDPLNPVLRLNVGGIYYSVKNYDLAVRFFTDSVNLKPDFANGYYNLSVALRDKGDLQGAQAAAEKVVSLIDPNSKDYQTASDYLKDLKARAATGSAQQSQITAPAAEEQSALQNKQLPQVLDLPKPEKISTPEAVKKPARKPAATPATNTETETTPTPTPAQ